MALPPRLPGERRQHGTAAGRGDKFDRDACDARDGGRPLREPRAPSPPLPGEVAPVHAVVDQRGDAARLALGRQAGLAGLAVLLPEEPADLAPLGGVGGAAGGLGAGAARLLGEEQPLAGELDAREGAGGVFGGLDASGHGGSVGADGRAGRSPAAGAVGVRVEAERHRVVPPHARTVVAACRSRPRTSLASRHRSPLVVTPAPEPGPMVRCSPRARPVRRSMGPHHRSRTWPGMTLGAGTARGARRRR